MAKLKIEKPDMYGYVIRVIKSEQYIDGDAVFEIPCNSVARSMYLEPDVPLEGVIQVAKDEIEKVIRKLESENATN